MSNTKCFICEKPLSGGLDTFGSVHEPRCQSCHFSGAQVPYWTNTIELDGHGNIISYGVELLDDRKEKAA